MTVFLRGRKPKKGKFVIHSMCTLTRYQLMQERKGYNFMLLNSYQLMLKPFIRIQASQKLFTSSVYSAKKRYIYGKVIYNGTNLQN